MKKFVYKNLDYNKILDLVDYELNDFFYSLEFIIYSLLSFFVPFFLAHPQLLVGSIVNCFLALAAFNLRGLKLLPIILLPSIGVFAAGLIFGNLSSALIYFIPFIWISNTIYVFLIKYFSFVKIKNKIIGLLAGAFLKSLFLFSVSFLAVSFKIVPEAFLVLMGQMQLTTALIGGFAAILIQKIKKVLV